MPQAVDQGDEAAADGKGARCGRDASPSLRRQPHEGRQWPCLTGHASRAMPHGPCHADHVVSAPGGWPMTAAVVATLAAWPLTA